MTLGSFHARTKDFASAVTVYEGVLALDPETRSRPDFWKELAGVYFHNHQFLDCARAYEYTLELQEEPDSHTRACHADALMSAGRYREARDQFASIEGQDPVLDAWIITKLEAASWVIDATSFHEQDREVDKAAELAGQLTNANLRKTEREELHREIWQLDAASPLGWFNAARHFLNEGEERRALLAYLTTAVMQEGDVEAWVNATLLALRVADYGLLVGSAVTGARLNDERYLNELARQLRAQISDPTRREEALTMIKQLLDAHPSEPGGEHALRQEPEGNDEPFSSLHILPSGPEETDTSTTY